MVGFPGVVSGRPESIHVSKRCRLPANPSTTAAGRKVYPRPPEARAQKLVRDLNPAKAPRINMRIWVGRDDEGIAAVVAWKWLDESTAVVQVVALARRLRGRGIVFTEELVDTASAQIAGDAADRGLEEV